MSLKTRNLVFKFLIASYIGVAIFRLTDPTLKWSKTVPTPTSQSNGSAYSTSPNEIKIGKINLDLKISPSVVKDNDWEVFDDRVAWLSTSALPGKGNVILYAHDRRGLFGDLYKLKSGDEIEVYEGGQKFSYKVTEVHKVLPTDVNSILTDKKRLTMYTCSGTFDQKRLVVYAE